MRREITNEQIDRILENIHKPEKDALKYSYKNIRKLSTDRKFKFMLFYCCSLLFIIIILILSFMFI